MFTQSWISNKRRVLAINHYGPTAKCQASRECTPSLWQKTGLAAVTNCFYPWTAAGRTLSELSKSSLSSPQMILKTRHHYHPPRHWKMQNRIFIVVFNSFILAAFVLSSVVLLRNFCCLCGTPSSSFIPPHTCFTVGFPSCWGERQGEGDCGVLGLETPRIWTGDVSKTCTHFTVTALLIWLKQ